MVKKLTFLMESMIIVIHKEAWDRSHDPFCKEAYPQGKLFFMKIYLEYDSLV
jgi:hypothetical protein